jgi:hypothetical protein
MTTVTPIITPYPTPGATNPKGELLSFVVQWLAMANGQTGIPVDLDAYSIRSVQVEGTFGAAGSVSIQGSNDGTNYETLRDPSNTALTFLAAGLKGVLEMTGLIRPNVTAGDGTTALTVTLFARKTIR